MQPLLNRAPGRFIAGRKIAGSGTLSRQKWLPVIVETRKPGDDVERPNAHFLHASALEKLAQRLGIAERKTPSLIVCQGLVVDGCGRIPELAQESCSLGGVPIVDCDDACRDRDAAHFIERTFRLRNVIQPQPADRHIEGGFSERKYHGISALEVDRRVAAMLAGKFNLLKRCVYTRNSSGRAAFDDGFREYAASAANVQPAQIRGQTQPVQELICQQAAPASHPLVVGCSGSPSVYTHRVA